MLRWRSLDEFHLFVFPVFQAIFRVLILSGIAIGPPLCDCVREVRILLKQKGCYSCPQILLPYIWTQFLELLRRERQHFSSLNLLQKVKESYNPLTIFGEWEGLFWCSQLYCIDKIVDYIEMWSLKCTGKINLHIPVEKNLSASFA